MTPILMFLLQLLESELPAVEAFVLEKLKAMDTSGMPLWEQVLIKMVISALSQKAAA